MIEKIEHEGELLALILRKELDPDTTVFYSDKESTLQLGIIKHEKGYVEPAHSHRRTQKIILDVLETIQMQHGTVEIDFYNEKGEKIKTCRLNEGDTALYGGRHRIKAITTFKGIKIKQGPYASMEDDKLFLEVKE